MVTSRASLKPTNKQAAPDPLAAKPRALCTTWEFEYWHWLCPVIKQSASKAGQQAVLMLIASSSRTRNSAPAHRGG